MFLNKICVATILLSIHAANTYILLTANLEDVHALAKQIAAFPIAQQLHKIFRRTSTIFNQHAQGNGDSKQKTYMKSKPLTGDTRQQPQMRTDPSLDDEPDYLNNEKDFRYSDTDVDAPIGPKKDVPLLNDDDEVEVWKPDPKVIEEELNAKMPDDTSNEYSDEDVGQVKRRRQMGPDLVTLGKNASFYLKSIKKIFENI
ncbi:uncharacterized protein LOC118271516 isoform X4 [Spodoptera frugiperda]|uniref:Uncharacterized protein LOC118271516 isoform X3 n=1 Tax=Spodoptera frugiperda TaxID=7108 RepID=A0A9R0DRA7_SPOFR|nr:uncharacterized protein LOC118271516 isoform X3 [Spodoptera frugiperda]XP_050551744.1 uncharacterized protein LOC118271516 isoform X4 [Spodoptera frugiperda]